MQVAGVQAQVDDVKITMEDNVQNMLKQVNHESNRIEFSQPPSHLESIECSLHCACDAQGRAGRYLAHRACTGKPGSSVGLSLV